MSSILESFTLKRAKFPVNLLTYLLFLLILHQFFNELPASYYLHRFLFQSAQ